ncbi:hypothetical protein [Paracoccus sp. DMF]|uniref:hypothetical protein n=1 Tax=Paracoccus sp. DMF TaxID=400837 RepID=UPI0010FFF31C|nr:hypothetical protein [Paracoccus sp. DMF]MCV2449532.1 hypothetical protein [Paracoccus sp. DMF]
MNPALPRPAVAPASGSSDWPADRIAEARAVVADVAHHSDHLTRFACKVLIQHGEGDEEREDARRLLLILDARRPLHARRSNDDDAAVRR